MAIAAGGMLVCVFLVVLVVLSGDAGRRRASARAVTSHHALAPVPAIRRLRTFVIGHSVQGRRIHAIELGGPGATQQVLVVGCIHGNEPAGIAVARALLARRPPRRTDLWIVPNLNPDGVAAHTRKNAHGVDLNRNFPWHWRPLGIRTDLQYSGPRPLSEPESRAARRLILRVRPQITIWFHQPLGLVDLSGGNAGIEQEFARLVGLPVRQLARYPGSAVSWGNALLPGTTAFVVELPPGALSAQSVARYTSAVLTLAVIPR